MNIFKWKLLWLGLVAVMALYFVFDYASYERNAAKNIDNCQNVQLEMTVEEVIDIMGEPESMRNLKKSIGEKYIDIFKYHYSTTLGASSGVDIYFSPETKLVVRVDCQ